MTESMSPNLSPALRSLYEFAGDWSVRQRLWREPDAKPEESKGRTQCRVLLDGLGVLMTTELTGANPMKGAALMTQDKEGGGLRMAWLDTFSGGGITIMTGTAGREDSRSELRERHANATKEREWVTRVGGQAEPEVGAAAAARSVDACLPQDVAALQSGGGVALAEQAADADLRIVENKVSDDMWVLEFFAPNPRGGQFLVQENTFRRTGREG